ncbi:MAG: HAD family hydrolase [Syntrophomonadaceae bacterium]|nr:HAD family hydrolase [Syntrophomonadaceae bacterium]
MGLVMFDYDGVIVDSYDQDYVDFVQVCRTHGLEINSKEEYDRLLDDNCYKVMKEYYGLDEGTIDAILKEWEKMSVNYVNLPIFKGIKDAIKKIAEQHRVIVITSNLSELVSTVLGKNGITEFEDILGADVEKSKVKKIRRAMKSYPSDISYYIGDTAGDMIEAREAGAKTIAVSWGYQSAERLKKADPDYLVNSPEELTALLCSVSAPTE